MNWLLYVYAVNSGHILAGSLGYYLNPLANVLLGRIVLKERLSWLQWTAVAVAAAGISALAMGALGQLWISLTLCVSFATYGLLRKIAPVDAVAGLAIETISCSRSRRLARLEAAAGACDFRIEARATPPAVAGRDRVDDAAAAVHRAARRNSLFDAGHAPVPRADVAVPAARSWLYGEPFTSAHAIAFAAIWAALVLYVLALVRTPRCRTIPE